MKATLFLLFLLHIQVAGAAAKLDVAYASVTSLRCVRGRDWRSARSRLTLHLCPCRDGRLSRPRASSARRANVIRSWSNRRWPSLKERAETSETDVTLRIVLGPQDDYFTEEGRATLVTSSCTTSDDSETSRKY